MFSSPPIKRLRKRYDLEHMPDVIDVPALNGRDACSLPLEQATLDDIEFALVEIGRQQSSLYDVSNSLKTLLRMARRQGALGSEIGVNAAIRDLEASQ